MCLQPGSFKFLLSVTKTLFLLCFCFCFVFWFMYFNNIFQMAMLQATLQVQELSQVHVYQSILYMINDISWLNISWACDGHNNYSY